MWKFLQHLLFLALTIYQVYLFLPLYVSSHQPHCVLQKVEAIYYTSFVPVPQCFHSALLIVYIQYVPDHALEPSVVWVGFLEEVEFELGMQDLERCLAHSPKELEKKDSMIKIIMYFGTLSVTWTLLGYCAFGSEVTHIISSYNKKQSQDTA